MDNQQWIHKTMNKTLINPTAGPVHWEPKFPFDLVVAYEDTSTRNRAIHLYDHLAQQLMDDYDFQCSWWKFDLLVSSPLLEQAADAAAEANMIIVALRAGNELPRAASGWLDAWAARKDSRKSALVALIGGLGQETRGSCPLQTHLQKIARQAHMDFFAHEFDLSETGAAFTREGIEQRAQAVTPVLDEILHHRIPVPRWGINE